MPKIVRSISAALGILALIFAVRGFSQTYTVSTPITGTLSMGVGGGGNLMPGLSGLQSFNLNLTNLSETIIVDKSANTIRQIGTITFAPDSLTNIVFTQNISPGPAAWNVTLAASSNVLIFDTGANPYSSSGIPGRYNISGANVTSFSNTFVGTYKVIVGNVTNTNKFTYTLTNVTSYEVASTFTSLQISSNVNTITLGNFGGIGYGFYKPLPQSVQTAVSNVNLVLGRNNYFGSNPSIEMLHWTNVNSVDAAISPAIITDVTNFQALAGSNFTLSVSVNSSSPVTYQWYWINSNPSQNAQAYAQTISGFVYGAVVTNGGFGYGNTPNVAFNGGGGSGAAGYAVVSNGVVTGITITNAGIGYTNVPQIAIGAPNGAIFGQTNSNLTLTNLSTDSLGGYFVVVSNADGAVSSSIGNLTLSYPPSIVVNPTNLNLSLHGNASLAVSATGTSPLSYQWTFNSSNIIGATGTNYSITNFAVTNIGNYAAVVSNPYGTATSTVASVQMIPSLTTPFAGLIGLWGQPATLSVGAVGSGTLNYQWYFNGAPITGANSNTYTIQEVQFTNAGLYSVLASSAFGSISNVGYQLVVNPANITLATRPDVVIQGTVGYVYTIQSTIDLKNTNSWVTETNLVLPASTYDWVDLNTDTSKASPVHKFYRVIPGQ